jgi:hypothetical protein
MSSGAVAMLEATRVGDWDGAAATLSRVETAWDAVSADEAPPRPIAERVRAALRALRVAVAAKQAPAAAQRSLDLGQSSLDLELRHRPPVEVDAARFELWTQQLRVDAARGDRDAVSADAAALEWIRDRFAHVLEPAGRDELDQRLRDLRAAVAARSLAGATDRAARLGARIRHLTERQPVG